MGACQAKVGKVSVAELRSVCEKGLLLLTITIPEMEVYRFLFVNQRFIAYFFENITFENDYYFIMYFCSTYCGHFC